MTDKAKRRLKNMDFDWEGAHMALVGIENGGPANGVTTLITKSKDDLTENQMRSLTEIIKSVQNVDDEQAVEIIDEMFSKGASDGSAKGVVEDDPISGVTTENTTTTPQDEVNKMTDKKVETPVDLEEVLKAKEAEMKAQAEVELQKALADKEAELKEIQKGLQEKLEAFEIEKAAREKAEHVELAKAYAGLGVTEEKQDSMAVALMKMKSDDELSVVMEVLEKAKNIQKAASEGMFEEQGHNVEADASQMTADEQLMAIAKAQYESK